MRNTVPGPENIRWYESRAKLQFAEDLIKIHLREYDEALISTLTGIEKGRESIKKESNRFWESSYWNPTYKEKDFYDGVLVPFRSAALHLSHAIDKLDELGKAVVPEELAAERRKAITEVQPKLNNAVLNFASLQQDVERLRQDGSYKGRVGPDLQGPEFHGGLLIVDRGQLLYADATDTIPSNITSYEVKPPAAEQKDQLKEFNQRLDPLPSPRFKQSH